MKKIAFFDFDGTVTSRDSMLELIKSSKGFAGFALGMMAVSPYLLAMKLRLVSNHLAKEKLLSWFFKGMDYAAFKQICEVFSRNHLPGIIRPGAYEMIRELQENGTEVVVVSASAREWVEPWCLEHGIELVSTCLETRDGRLTGKISGKNCHGNEKVRRIREQYKLEDYSMVQCFGDTSGDLPMLKLAHEAFYKPFR